jgi:hypothetical protein
MSLSLGPEILAHIVSVHRLEERRGHRSSGIPLLDEILGGGWPRAALAELRGRRSSGRTAILYASLACSMGAGQTVALVDTGGTLDPRYAEAAGIVLPRLLWIRSAPAQSLKATDLVVAAGGFDLVALDLGDDRPRAPTAAWIRLRHGAERQGTTIVVATPVPAVGSFAAAAIELSATAPSFVGTSPWSALFTGLRAQATPARGGAQACPFGGHAPCASLAFSYPG